MDNGVNNMNNQNKKLIEPHGGKLVTLIVKNKEREKLIKEIDKNKIVRISTLEFSDLIMLGIGAFSPLEAFMIKKDYESILKNMRLSNGVVWPIPVILSVSYSIANKLAVGDNILLSSPYDDEIVGQLNIEEIYIREVKKESKVVFGTNDCNHPGVAKLFNSDNKCCLGGKVKLFSEGRYPKEFPQYARPDEVRKIFKEECWSNITAFQTRNPIHRSHEYLTKIALEISDGLFIHPVVGELKPGDIPAEVRIKCYEVLIEKYYPKNRVVFKVYPMEMRYAGPKEAVLHAIIRQNFGCSHIIIGRDHAGVGNYYRSFDVQDIFDQYNEKDLKIKPIKVDWAFWCLKCGQLASKRTCPHPDKDHVLISGTKLREMLSKGVKPSETITSPKLRKYWLIIIRKLYIKNNVN